jgi:hypothetical protein
MKLIVTPMRAMLPMPCLEIFELGRPICRGVRCQAGTQDLRRLVPTAKTALIPLRLGWQTLIAWPHTQVFEGT